jgi:predicted histone-like DNA-binding protein
MALNYSITMLGNPQNKNEEKKAYAKAQINGQLSLKELSTEVASKCTVHRADVSAVLIATVESMLAALKAGKQVDFGELGKFRLQISSKGAMSAKQFTSANIKGVNIQYIPGEDLDNLFDDMEFNLVTSRELQAKALRAQKNGDTVIDLTEEEEDETPTPPEDNGEDEEL